MAVVGYLTIPARSFRRSIRDVETLAVPEPEELEVVPGAHHENRSVLSLQLVPVSLVPADDADLSDRSRLRPKSSTANRILLVEFPAIPRSVR